jgi:hypothetical protein
VNLGDSYGEPKNIAFRHSAKKYSTAQYLHATVSSQVEILDGLSFRVRRSRNAGHQASVHSIQRQSQPADREADRLHWRDHSIGWFYFGSV